MQFASTWDDLTCFGDMLSPHITATNHNKFSRGWYYVRDCLGVISSLTLDLGGWAMRRTRAWYCDSEVYGQGFGPVPHRRVLYVFTIHWGSRGSEGPQFFTDPFYQCLWIDCIDWRCSEFRSGFESILSMCPWPWQQPNKGGLPGELEMLELLLSNPACRCRTTIYTVQWHNSILRWHPMPDVVMPFLRWHTAETANAHCKSLLFSIFTGIVLSWCRHLIWNWSSIESIAYLSLPIIGLLLYGLYMFTILLIYVGWLTVGSLELWGLESCHELFKGTKGQRIACDIQNAFHQPCPTSQQLASKRRCLNCSC